MKKGYVLLACFCSWLPFCCFSAARRKQPAPTYSRCMEGGPSQQPTWQKAFLPLQLAPCTGIPPVVREVPYETQWADSAHNDWESEAFRHWDNANPPEIPTSCAKCHSTIGYEDFLGSDDSEAGVVNKASPIGTTVECVACHNVVADHKSDVKFPSGKVITDQGAASNCMECHQGASSMVKVNSEITDAALANDDTPSATLVWTDVAPHYFTAAISMFGKEAEGGYQYPDMEYDVRFQHVEGYDTCQSCHNQHSLEIKYEECVECHEEVDAANPSPEQLRDIRQNGSGVDYDGDGDRNEGMYYEVFGLREKLYEAIQRYATQVSGKGIVFDGGVYPYWFNDTNGNGKVDSGEAVFANQYKSFTNRLLKAAYNYQVSIKDPGQYAHGGKYIIQLMYDSIVDLNPKINPAVDLSAAHRLDPGHFAASQMAWRDWDNEGEPMKGETSQACARCHTAVGLPLIVKNTSSSSGLPPVTVSAGNTYPISLISPVTSAMMCSTCHKQVGEPWDRLSVPKVVFPSGVTKTFDTASIDDNLCMACHLGRQSTVSVNVRIGTTAPDDTLPTGSTPLPQRALRRRQAQRCSAAKSRACTSTQARRTRAASYIWRRTMLAPNATAHTGWISQGPPTARAAIQR